MGILRYNGSSAADPTTQRQKYPTACSDEPYSSLVPIVPWKVEAPSNERKSNKLSIISWNFMALNLTNRSTQYLSGRPISQERQNPMGEHLSMGDSWGAALAKLQ
jgi:hypothetical protein